jgi:hypothetical protein
MQGEEIAKVAINSAVSLNLNPMYLLPDLCEILSEGDSSIYKRLFNDAHKVLFKQRHTIPWLIEKPENI